MTAISDARFWDRTARKYAASAVDDPEGYERTLARTLGFLQKNHSVLELGCGTGTTALRLAHAAGSYRATDISEAMIAIAGDRLREAPCPGLAFRQAVAEDFLAGDDRFDVILGFNYLHLTRDPRATLRTIRRLLKPQGIFISKTPCVGEMNLLIRRLLLPAMRAVGKAPHVSVFSVNELKQLMSDEAFTIVELESHASKGSQARPFIVAVTA